MIFLLLFFLELFVLFFVSQFLTKSLSHLFYKITRSQTMTINLLSVLFLPGVIVHELSHMFSAALLMVPVGEIEFMPKVMEGGVKMGSVGVGKTDPIRRAIIGFAPVLVGVALIIGSIYYLYGLSSLTIVWKLAIILFMVFEIGNTMFSSRKDLEGTLELLLVFVIIFAALYFVGVRIPENFTSFIFSENNLEYFRKANLFLLAPIAVDSVIILIAKTINSK